MHRKNSNVAVSRCARAGLLASWLCAAGCTSARWDDSTATAGSSSCWNGGTSSSWACNGCSGDAAGAILFGAVVLGAIAIGAIAELVKAMCGGGS